MGTMLMSWTKLFPQHLVSSDVNLYSAKWLVILLCTH